MHRLLVIIGTVLGLIGGFFIASILRPEHQTAIQTSQDPSPPKTEDAQSNALTTRAIVAPDKTVVICFRNATPVFGDRCKGPALLELVQPIVEGSINWKTSEGVVADEPEQIPASPRPFVGQWDQKNERNDNENRKITIIDPSDPDLTQAVQSYFKHGNYGDAHITYAFSVDLYGDGRERTVFVSDNTDQADALFQKDGEPHKFLIAGGIRDRENIILFHTIIDNWNGATDAFGPPKIVGLTRLDPSNGRLAIVVDLETGLEPGPHKIVYVQDDIHILY